MMGAVRTKIKLTNAVDEELVNRGLLASHLLRECEVEALVDTRAVYLVIPDNCTGVRFADSQSTAG